MMWFVVLKFNNNIDFFPWWSWTLNFTIEKPLKLNTDNSICPSYINPRIRNLIIDYAHTIRYWFPIKRLREAKLNISIYNINNSIWQLNCLIMLQLNIATWTDGIIRFVLKANMSWETCCWSEYVYRNFSIN